MLNKEFEIAGDKELADTKEWFFRETVRLAEEKERIFEERRKLEHEFRGPNRVPYVRMPRSDVRNR